MAAGDPLCAARASEKSDSTNATSTRNGHVVLALALTEFAEYIFWLPYHYAGGGITIETAVALASATANNVRIETQIERIGFAHQDIDADGYASAKNSGNVVVPGTSGHVLKLTTTHADGSEMDGLQAGEWFRLLITRAAVTAGSDAAGNVQLLGLAIRETP